MTMNTYFLTGSLLAGALGVSAVTTMVAPQAQASELGHYTPAIYKPRDFFVPPSGTYLSIIQLYYTSDTYRDGHGQRVNEIDVGPISIAIDADIDSWMTLPTFVYVPDAQLWGADFGFMIVPTFGNISFQAALEIITNPEFALEIDDTNFGLGDLYVKPVWLGWDFDNSEVGVHYGVHIPTGKYSAGAADNIGLGMWSHEFQVAGAWYPDEQRGTALTMAATYEINQDKDEVDINPGSHFSLNLGLSQYIPLSPTMLAEVAISGFGQWQMSEDSGASAVNRDVKDKAHGIGLQGSLIYLPWNASFSLHWIHEFQVEDRFEGDFFFLSGAFTF